MHRTSSNGILRQGLLISFLLTLCQQLVRGNTGFSLSPQLLSQLLWTEPNAHLQIMGKISDTDGSLERTFLSPAHRKAAVQLQSFMNAAGLETSIDAVANVRGKIKSSQKKDKRILLTGSHYDTVKDAGKYDGMLGIIVPIAAIKTLLLERAITAGYLTEADLLGRAMISVPDLLSRSQIDSLLDGPVEILGFSDEEGIRFQTTFLGSREISGSLISSGALKARDSDGISLEEALSDYNKGEVLDKISALAMDPADVRGYVEVHMEQGPILEAEGIPLGVVKGIAGQARYFVTISGTQGHAGTVPMKMRKDPMPAVAEILNWIEKLCGGGNFPDLEFQISEEDNLMCTTGNVDVWPNAFNVIPGSVNFTLDIRSRNDATWQRVVEKSKLKIQEVCNRRKLDCKVAEKNTVNAIHSDTDLLRQLENSITDSRKVSEAIKSGCKQISGNGESKIQKQDWCIKSENLEGGSNKINLKIPALVSGAGHDALAMSKIAKMAMLFVRCRGGYSHSPLEYVSPSDVSEASAAMFSFLKSHLIINERTREEL